MKKLLLLLMALLSLGGNRAWAETGTITVMSSTQDWTTTGTFYDGTGWTAWWISNESPNLRLVCTNANRFIHGANKQLANCEYAMVMPYGYNITGYSIKFTSTSSTSTVTGWDNARSQKDQQESTGTDDEKTLTVSDISTQVVEFKVANNYINVKEFSVTYATNDKTAPLTQGAKYRINGWYSLYLYSDSEDNTILKKGTATSSTLITDANYIWSAATWDGTNLQLQNVGSSKYIAPLPTSSGMTTKLLTATTTSAAETFLLVDRTAYADGYIALLSKSHLERSNASPRYAFLDNYSSSTDSYVGRYNLASHDGNALNFTQVKTVTFSKAVSVSGTTASTIYVATDGSDSFTLPSDYMYVIGFTLYDNTSAVNAIKAAGTADISVSVVDAPVENEKLYRLVQTWGSTNFFLYANTSDATNGNRLWKNASASTLKLTDGNYIWQAKANGNYWQIYNPTSWRYIAKATTTAGAGNADGVTALSATTTSDAESFVIYETATTGKYCMMSTTQNTYLNSYSSNSNQAAYDYVGWYNAVHDGYYFQFIPVKTVTFSEAVAVNDGSAVSTIYVATDGSDNFELPNTKLYSIGGAAAVTCTEAVEAIRAAGTSDITVTVSDNPTKNVTYNLQWSDGTQIYSVANVTTYLSNAASLYVPSSFLNDFVTLSYSPETITSETSAVTVTATWNGPFQISTDLVSAIWYTVGEQSSYESSNHIWKYNSDNDGKLSGPAVATDAYDELSDDHLFCFIGNPYNGIAIYNKSAGDSKTIYLGTSNSNSDQAQMSTSGSLFIPVASSASEKTVANGYCCFKLKDNEHTCYLNLYGTWNLYGWNANGPGSTCWFFPAGQYYLNYIDGLVLDAPVGAVGTSAYFTTINNPATYKSTLTSMRSTIAGSLYGSISDYAIAKGYLDPIKAASTITLGTGYWRIESAYPSFATMPAIYYDQTNDKLKWSTSALTDASYRVNNVFKFEDGSASGTYTIYSPNKQKYLSSTATGQSAEIGNTLGDAGTDVTFTSLGNAQYDLKVGSSTYAVHADSHGSGAGTSGTLVGWNEDGSNLNSPSSWYIVEVTDIDLNLNGPVDDNYYATLYLPFDVTVSGADAYTLTLNGAKNALTLTAVTDGKVPAGTPVLLRGTNPTATATINTGTAFDAIGKGSLTGTYTDLTVTAATDYFLGSDGTTVGFYKWDGTTLKANRAYLTAASIADGGSVKGFALNFDIETAIESLNAQEAEQGSIFNLAGQRVQKPVRGLYIKNGKKVLFR